MGRRRARAIITAGRVSVNGAIEIHLDQEIDRFTQVEFDGVVVRKAERLLHIMLHKPIGVVSATVDAEHRTVVDLIDDPDKMSLHLVGRLDRNTSGLMLLTNDGRWSKALMDPERKVPKVYLVETNEPIPTSAVQTFAEGFYFHTEDLTTLPAELELLDSHGARLTLHEGRYHQVRRMFAAVGNHVAALHRDRIGRLALPEDLAPGEFRVMTAEDIALVFPERAPAAAPGADA